MAKRNRSTALSRLFTRNLKSLTRNSLRAGAVAAKKAVKLAAAPRKPPAAAARKLAVAAPRKPAVGAGHWTTGVALGPLGMRRYRLYRPPGVKRGERLPLLVMLHGCTQDAAGFARSTHMNRIAARERFLVLYPEQDRLANAQGCWNWFEIRNGRAAAEAALILRAIDQVCSVQAVDPARVAIAGFSAGASMAALLVSLHPQRFRAVVMHSGIPPGTASSALSALSAMHGRRATSPLAVTPVAMAASWPPLLVIHGAVDKVVSVSNGQAAARTWANAAGAVAGPTRVIQRGKRHPMAVTDYKASRGVTVATMVEVAGLGHAWSGGAASQPYCDAQGPDASRLLWAFAARQFAA
jgi:poly(hydroxyalkanoate) depolymerase family esterase